MLDDRDPSETNVWNEIPAEDEMVADFSVPEAYVEDGEVFEIETGRVVSISEMQEQMEEKRN